MLKRNEVIVAGALLTLIAYTLGLCVLASVQTSRTVFSTGTVKAIGVGVYRNSECTSPLSSINWTMLEPGTSKNFTCYIKNEGNSALNLSMYTSNWNPLNASQSITLKWDGEKSINPNEVLRVTFTLSVLSSIKGITNFSFYIVIIGSS